VFRPDGAHLFVRRKLAALGRFLRQSYRGALLGGELDDRLIYTGKL
jgi:hypothetical protein